MTLLFSALYTDSPAGYTPEMVLESHAYIAAGEADSLSSVLALLESEGVTKQGSPDIYARVYGSFSIDDARDIKSRAALRPVRDARRVFIIIAATMNAEAQNALLKTFEDPAAPVLFFLVVPNPGMLLPTLRSRLTEIVLARSGKSNSPVDATAFLSASSEKRLSMLAVILDKDERDVAGALAFLSDLERALASHLEDRDVRDGIRAIYLARAYIVDKGSLMKALLEQVALLVPQK